MMDFYQALRQIQNGKEVRRSSWDDESVTCEMVDGIVSINTMEGTTDAWIISIGDMLAEDWIIAGEETDIDEDFDIDVE